MRLCGSSEKKTKPAFCDRKFFIGYGVVRFHRKIWLFQILFFTLNKRPLMQYSIFLTLPFAFVTKYCQIRQIKPDKWDFGREIRVRTSTLAGFPFNPLPHILVATSKKKKEEGVFLQMIPVKRNKGCCDLAYFNARRKMFDILLWELRFF